MRQACLSIASSSSSSSSSSSLQQQHSKLLAAGGAGAGPPCASTTSGVGEDKKRRELGKRKIAELETRLKQQRKSVAALLKPATEEELHAVEHAGGCLVFLWHYADGSSSAKPREQPKDSVYNPRRDPAAIGASILALGASGTGDEPPSVSPTPQLSAVGCLPLRRAASEPMESSSAPSASPAPSQWVTQERCVHWLLPARLRVRHSSLDEEPHLQEDEHLCERSWRLVRGLLCNSHQARCSTIVVPNAQLALRTLALVCEQSTSSLGGGYRGGSHMWPALERWCDPRMMAWLVEPDANEDALLLEGLRAIYLGADEASDDGTPESALRLSIELARALRQRLAHVIGEPDVVERVLRREMRIAELLASMELGGLPIDPSALTTHREAIATRMGALTSQAGAMLKRSINLSSPQQVSQALHVDLGLPKPKHGNGAEKAGHGTTSEAHLLELSKSHAHCKLPSLILEYRELAKLSTCFLEPLANRAVASTGSPLSSAGTAGHLNELFRLHTQWFTAATGTGRLSSRHPNVQQVPKRPTTLSALGTDESKTPVHVRDAFRPAEGFVLLSADYSQLEMRLLAILSGDPRLVNELRAGGDLFRRLAALWHRAPLEDVTSTEREQTKQCCYGIIYGLGVERLAQNLDTSVQTARTLKQGFENFFSQLLRFTSHLKAHARRVGGVATLGGRCRPLPNIASSVPGERAKSERQAVNSVIQGSAADLMKEAMLRCCDRLACHGVEACLLAQIHDEVLFEVAEAHVERCAAIVRETLEMIDLDGRPLPPMPVSIVVGRTWGSMAPLVTQ
jgi:DNA polymerase I-like protein with 3'-5' exonuclease and polymerase domains